MVGRAGRPLDVEATKVAQARHALGRRNLNRVFNGDAAESYVRQAEAIRRVEQGQGGSATKPHWTRTGRRRKGKAQRAARRANR